MAILDNIEEKQIDVRSISYSSSILCPESFSRCCILILNNIPESNEYINMLRERIDYLFGADDYLLTVLKNQEDIKHLKEENYFWMTVENATIVIIQFNNRLTEYQNVRFYILLFMCFQSDYINTNDLHIIDVISTYTTPAHPDIFVNDYTTRTYTPGIIWKYYYTEKIDDLKSLQHIVKWLISKLYPANPVYNDTETYQRFVSHLKRYKNELIRRNNRKRNQ